MKKQYEKPNAEKIRFSIQEALMDEGDITTPTGSGTTSPDKPGWFAAQDNGYQLH